LKIVKKEEIDEDFKDLIKKLSAFDSEDRISIEEIKKHPWYVKPIYRSADLKKIMSQLI